MVAPIAITTTIKTGFFIVGKYLSFARNIANMKNLT
jgi:hypothetical protein